MAWYSGAKRMELQPESDDQPAIRPTQLILHSIAGPWTSKRTYEYWRDSTNLESHFGLGYAGDLGQYIGTETRADANASANRRADGSGAVSVETASNVDATDPWTPEQIEELIGLGVWMHQHHGMPLRLCRTADDAGVGYHRQFAEWNPSGHSCPGPARIKQLTTVVLPGMIARAAGQTPEEDDDMPITDADAEKIAAKVLSLDGVIPNANPATKPTNAFIALKTSASNIEAVSRRVDKNVASLLTQVAGLSAAVTALAGQFGDDVDTATVVAAVEAAIAKAVVKVDVSVGDATS
ncbi:peptidoglycan recognition protein family protein [Actinacidiphila glaucinigra]|uniref:peptidoglycan recognition protein family protein n=1 Tax=Actinacidiphila glaucinigra TaxID=235986 RepID=UPI0035E1FFF5